MRAGRAGPQGSALPPVHLIRRRSPSSGTRTRSADMPQRTAGRLPHRTWRTRPRRPRRFLRRRRTTGRCSEIPAPSPVHRLGKSQHTPDKGEGSSPFPSCRSSRRHRFRRQSCSRDTPECRIVASLGPYKAPLLSIGQSDAALRWRKRRSGAWPPYLSTESSRFSKSGALSGRRQAGQVRKASASLQSAESGGARRLAALGRAASACLGAPQAGFRINELCRSAWH